MATNLDKAIQLLDNDERNDFKQFSESKTFNPIICLFVAQIF